MIKQALIRPKTLKQLFALLSKIHTEQSLKIHLDWLIELGKVGFEDGKYYYKKSKKTL